MGAFPAQAQVSTATEESPPAWNRELLFQPPHTYPAADITEEGVTGLFYDGLPYRGNPTRVFAWVGKPQVPAGTKVPGIVLVHGGGGTAFASWARLWVSRGYAVIAMDNCGGVPVQAEPRVWKRHEHSGPPGWGGFGQIDEPAADQWTYHAVADILLANSLLRSMPEVDAERIGVTGISWGGYLTCIAAGLDERFKFAVPVYGCGFTNENGFVISLNELKPDDRVRWMKWWDPSVYLGQAKMPMLWVNGSNDRWYTMNAFQKSYRLPQGPRTICLRLRMPHSHGPVAENPVEIHVFADSVVKGGVPLASITRQGQEANSLWAEYSSPGPIVRAELNYTRDTGTWPERHWHATPAQIEGNRISGIIPPDAKVVYLNLFDDRECAVSSEHVELP